MESWQVVTYYLLSSALAFVAYWIDKSASQAGRRRIPESRLHLLTLMGGWPGAWLAQRYLRHKTRKRSFQVIYWTTVVLHCGALAWMVSPYGGRALQGWIQ